MAEQKPTSIRRFGARYGRTPKMRFGRIETEQRKLHKCPFCSQVKVKRISAGIWQCRKCDAKFTGKAYTITKKKKVSPLSEEVVEEILEEDKEEEEDFEDYDAENKLALKGPAGDKEKDQSDIDYSEGDESEEEDDSAEEDESTEKSESVEEDTEKEDSAEETKEDAED